MASLSPQLMSGFVLGIADIGLLIGLYHAPGNDTRFSRWCYRRTAWGQTRCAHRTGAYGHRRDCRGDRADLADSDGRADRGRNRRHCSQRQIIKMVADWFTSKEAAMAISGSSAPAGIALALATE